jgi:hypothetical protein
MNCIKTCQIERSMLTCSAHAACTKGLHCSAQYSSAYISVVCAIGTVLQCTVVMTDSVSLLLHAFRNNSAVLQLCTCADQG